MSIDEMITAIGSIDIEDMTITSLMEHSDEVVAENVMQMRRGLMPDGSLIEPEYSRLDSQYGSYAWSKREGGWNAYDLPERPYYTPNLAKTGAFHEGLYMERNGNEAEIKSADSKWEFIRNKQSLHERYGEVLGIPEEYMENTLREQIKEGITNQIRAIL